MKAEHGRLDNKDGLVFLQTNTFRDTDGVIKDLPADLNAYFTGAGLDWAGFRDTDGDFFTGTFDSPARDENGNIVDLRNDVERNLYSATFSWDLGGVTLSSVTGYLSANMDYLDRLDSGPLDSGHVGITVETEEFVQELRLSGESGKLNWTVGAFYFNWKIDNDLYFLVAIRSRNNTK